MSTNFTQSLLDHSRTIAEHADLLSLAVAKDDQYDIEGQLDDLIVAYDRYANPAADFSGHYGFSEVASQPTSDIRAQSVNHALASALFDLEVADILAQAAQASGELEGQADASAISESVAALNETIQALQGPSGTQPTTFAFGEAAQPQPVPAASPDLPTAKAVYFEEINQIYERLMTDTTTLLVTSFKGIDQLDMAQIQQGTKQVSSIFDFVLSGKLIPRILDGVKRAIQTLQNLAGPDGMKQIDERISQEIKQVKEGGNALQLFLKYSYQYEQNQKLINGWVEATKCDIAEIDAGRQKLEDLRKDLVNTFIIFNKIVTTLSKLKSVIGYILKLAVATAPLDLVMACLFFTVADIALLRGMDFADTTTIVKFVDGTLTISRRSLAIRN